MHSRVKWNILRQCLRNGLTQSVFYGDAATATNDAATATKTGFLRRKLERYRQECGDYEQSVKL